MSGGKNIQGFSLIELAIVLAIVSFIIVSTVTTSENVTGLGKKKRTVSDLTTITNVLNDYATANGSFPCPADPTLSIDDANFGTEAETSPGSNTCDDTVLLCDTSSPKVCMGAVPFKTLGLPLEAAFDAWGRRISYTVDGNNVISDAATGSIVILSDYSSGDPTDTGTQPNVLEPEGKFLLISFGEDGIGAWNADGTHRIEPSLVTSEYVDSLQQFLNHHTEAYIGNTLQPFDRAFIKPTSPFGNNVTPIQFDDVVMYAIASSGGGLPGGASSPPAVSYPLRLHWNAGDLTKLYQNYGCSTPVTSTGQNVKCWVDSVTGNRARHSGSGALVRYETAGTYRFSVVELFGGRFLSSENVSSNQVQPNTIFVVGAFDSLGTNETLVDSNNSSREHALRLNSGGGAYTIDSGSAVNGGTSSGSPSIYSIIFNSPSSALYRNGSSVISGANTGTERFRAMRIGANYSGGNVLNGTVAEILVYYNALNATDRQSVECHLGEKWGITVTGC